MMNWGRGFAVLAWIGLAFVLSNNISSANSKPDTANNPVPPRKQAGAPAVDTSSRAGDLIGKRVESVRGETLGVVTDLVIDTRSGRLEYVIIASGGFAGIGRQQKPVPPGALSAATVKR